MQLNLFHKIVLAFAFLVLGVGIFDAVSKNIVDPYSDIGTVTAKYNLIESEPLLAAQPKFLSQAWLKNVMVSSFINLSTTQDIKHSNTLILKVDNPNPTENIYLLSFPDNAPLRNIQRDLELLPAVKYAEPNYDVALQQEATVETDTPTDSEANTEINVEITSEATPEVTRQELPTLKINRLNNPYKVAIIDSGLDETHDAFKDKKVVTNSLIGSKKDVVGHGTHLAGIILNYAPTAEVYSYKFTDGKVGKLSDVLRAMHMAYTDKVNLVNLSLGLSTKSSALQESVQLLSSNDIIVVAAAGNLNANVEFYPAAYENVISVGGLNTVGNKLTSSNFGPWIDYSILGQNIYSTSPNNNYTYLSGTSQSAAAISGLIAQYYLNTSLQDQPVQDYLNALKFEREDTYKDLLGIRLQEKVLTSSP